MSGTGASTDSSTEGPDPAESAGNLRASRKLPAHLCESARSLRLVHAVRVHEGALLANELGVDLRQLELLQLLRAGRLERTGQVDLVALLRLEPRRFVLADVAAPFDVHAIIGARTDEEPLVSVHGLHDDILAGHGLSD